MLTNCIKVLDYCFMKTILITVHLVQNKTSVRCRTGVSPWKA